MRRAGDSIGAPGLESMALAPSACMIHQICDQ